MKLQRRGLLHFTSSWLVICSVALAPLFAHADEAANDNYNPRHLPVVITPANNSIKVIKQDEVSAEDVKNVQAAAATQIIDPETNKDVPLNTFFKSNSTEEERRATSPKNLLKKYMEATQRGEGMSIVVGADGKPTKKRGLILDTAVHFPAEASSFYAAMGVLAVAELNVPGSESSKNPAVLDQFIEHSIKDPIGAIGFYGFMLMNRHSAAFLQGLSFMADDPAKFAPIKSLFKGILISQVSMSAGFLAQTVFTELYHDKEAHMCLARWGVKKVNKLSNGQRLTLSPDSPEILEACENAYDRWALRQKIKDYLPMISSMIAVGALQSAAIPFAKWIIEKDSTKVLTGALMRTRGIGAILEGLSLTFRFGRNFVFPEGGLVIRIASMVAFLKATELIQPFFDDYFGSRLKADDLADITNRFEQKLNSAAQNKWQDVHYTDLSDARKNDPAELLKKVSAQYLAFRQYQLQKAYSNHSNWQQGLSKFQASYISAYSVYDHLISDVREFRERGNNNRYVGQNPPALYLSRESPIYRVGTLIPKNLAKYHIGSDPLSDLLIRIRDYYLANQKNLTAQQDLILRNINLGLESAYRDLTQSELDAAIKKTNLNPATLTAEQRESIATELRAKRVDNALKLFKLAGHGLNQDSGLGFKIAASVKGAINDFKQDPKSLKFNEFIWTTYTALIDFVDVAVTVAGYDYYHRELGTDPKVIPEAAQRAVPSHYEKAYTPNMADYLLASMVCGPKSVGGAAAKENQTGLVTKALNWFNFNNDKKQTFKELSLVQYTPGYGFEFLPPRLVQDSIANNDLCGHTPNRAKVQNVLTAAGEFMTGQSAEKQNISVMSYFNVNTGEYKVNKDVHYGFLPLVKFYLDPKFLAKPTGNSSPFFNYWQAEVEPQAKHAVLGFERMYRQIVFEDFVPKFISGEYRIHKNRKIHYGAGWSLREEGLYYADLLKRMISSQEIDQKLKIFKRNLELSVAMFSQPEKVKQATDIILRTMKDEVQVKEQDKSADDILSEVSDTDAGFTPQQIATVRTAADPAAQAATAILLKSLKLNMDNIKSLVEKANMRGTAKNVAGQLVKNMEQVTGEATSYNGIIRAANLEGLPEVSDL